MQIQIQDERDADFPVKIAGIDVTTLYDTAAIMSCTCMLYACYTKLKDPPYMKTVPAMPVHSVTGHSVCPLGVMCYEIQ